MSASPRAGVASSPLHSLLQNVPNLLLAPVPLAVLQPIFTRIAAHVAQSRPELFARLRTACAQTVSDRSDRFAVRAGAGALTPTQPHLRAYRRYEKPAHDAGIAGTFFNLLDMIDGSLDGDALFFSRDLRVSGDTEAVVALRNALDDFEGSALDSVVSSFGALSAPAALALSAVRAVRGTQHHDSRNAAP